MDFTKYDPMRQKKQSDLETGFTSADYDDHASAPGRAEPWMTSTSVILLIEYMRKHQDQGVILYERFGSVGLKFEPGINNADIKNGRAQIAMNLFGLLQDATADLKTMIAAGIDVPLLIHYQVDSRLTNQSQQPTGDPKFSARVLSAKPSIHGNSNLDFSLLREK